MKKLLSIIMLIGITGGVALAETAKIAEYKEKPTYGGYYIPKQNYTTTVSKALKKSDNTYVILNGYIIKRLSDDMYVFKDSTGTINLEINNDKWLGQTFDANDKVEITGEVEKDFASIKIDVKSIKKIK